MRAPLPALLSRCSSPPSWAPPRRLLASSRAPSACRSPPAVARSVSVSVDAPAAAAEPAVAGAPSATPRRRLILLRHGDSAAGSRSTRDHDRPLSKAGRADAISISNKLQQMGWIPELILCSDATRTKEGASFVEQPTDFASHSMLHQTLIPSSFSPSVSASSSSPFLHASNAATPTAPAAPGGSCTFVLRGSSSAMPSYAHHHGSSPLDDGRMDVVKCTNSAPPEETAEDAAAAGALVEKDGFSVEDLLDLEEFGEPDQNGAEHEDDAPPVAAAAAAVEEGSKADSQPLSAVTYELPPPLALPPPEMVDLPSHDVEELEWVSRIMDDSLSELPPQPQQQAAAVVASLAGRPPLAQQRRPPLAHVGSYRAVAPPPPPPLGPLRTPTICALSTEAMIPVKAKRSKRSRGPGWSRSGASFLSDSDSASSSSTTTTSSCSSSGSFSPFLRLDSPPFIGGLEQLGEGYYSQLFLPRPPPSKKSKHGGKGGKHKPKKRGRKPKHHHLPPHPSAAAGGAAQQQQQPGPSDRRCSHCGVQKTPQWRAGPEGAKTLCNACGVRYKSGRLLPEYRPACSPTFVSTIHSNSHRKVLEMRRQKEGGGMVTAAAAPAVASF